MNGHHVVVELKRNKATDQVAGQILRYLGWVEGNLPKGKNLGALFGRSILIISIFVKVVSILSFGKLAPSHHNSYVVVKKKAAS